MKTPDIKQALFNLLNQAGKTQALELIPGQVISVLPKEIRGDLALLSYQGKELLARLDVPIAVGERLRCMVEGEVNGQVILRVIPEIRSDLTGEGMRKLVAGLGVPDDIVGRRLVGEMIRQEMPLDSETTTILGSFIRSGKIPETDIWLAVLMQKNGIALSQQSFTQVKNLVTDLKFLQPDLGGLLDRLQVFIESPGTPGGLKQLATEIYELVKNLQFESSDGQEAMAGKLARAIQIVNPPGSESLPAMLKQLAARLSGGSENQFKGLAELSGGLAGKLEFVQDFNLKNSSNPESLMIMHAMVRSDESEEPFRLMIKYRSDEKNAKQDFTSCRLEISLHTDSLGLVSCEVKVNNRKLDIQFLAENERSASVIDGVKGILGARLEEMDFSVKLPDCSVRTENENFILDDKQDINKFFRLNIRV